MLIKLESYYEINPDRITIEYRSCSTVVHVDGLVIPITDIELELIRAYHDGKNVNATLEEIKKRMEKAKETVLQKERQKIVDDFFRSFCNVCKNDPKTSLECNNCSLSFEWSEDQSFIKTHSIPKEFQPKQ